MSDEDIFDRGVMKRNRRIGNQTPALFCHTRTTVRFSEVDAMQVVWHGEYVRYFEDGRESFGREYPGIGYMDFFAHGYTAPIVDLQLQYVAPLTINDVAIIETRYIETVAAKLCFEYIVRREPDGTLMARGSSVQVFLDPEGVMCLNSPKFYEEWKSRWLAKE